MQSPLHPNYLHATGVPNEGMEYGAWGIESMVQGAGRKAWGMGHGENLAGSRQPFQLLGTKRWTLGTTRRRGEKARS
jgi:hypothetical protein